MGLPAHAIGSMRELQGFEGFCMSAKQSIGTPMDSHGVVAGRLWVGLEAGASEDTVQGIGHLKNS